MRPSAGSIGRGINGNGFVLKFEISDSPERRLKSRRFTGVIMTPTFKKLNLKNQRQVLVLNAPESFEPELASLHDVVVLRKIEDAAELEFSLAFVTKQQEVDALGKALAKRVRGDAVVWFA